MEKSIHVRGEIDKLELGGAPLVVPKVNTKFPEYDPLPEG